MLIVNVSALSMYRMTDGPNHFHALAALSLSAVVPGAVAAVLRKITAHYFFMSWSYVGLLAAFLSQLATQAPAILESEAPLGASPLLVVGAATAGVVLASAVIITAQSKPLLRRYARRRSPG